MIERELILRQEVREWLKKSVPPKLRRQIRNRIERLRTDPAPSGSGKVQSMKIEGYEVRRARQGDHRIIYGIHETGEHIVILSIGHRKDVYR